MNETHGLLCYLCNWEEYIIIIDSVIFFPLHCIVGDLSHHSSSYHQLYFTSSQVYISDLLCFPGHTLISVCLVCSRGGSFCRHLGLDLIYQILIHHFPFQTIPISLSPLLFGPSIVNDDTVYQLHQCRCISNIWNIACYLVGTCYLLNK